MAVARRIVMIDDEPAILKMLKRVCEKAGYLVEATQSPAKFRQLALTKPDFVLIDLLMPGVDGVELLRFLAGNKVEAAIVLVSGAAPRIVESAARLATAQGLNLLGKLAKPFEISALLAILARTPTVHHQLPASTTSTLLATDLAAALVDDSVVAHFQAQVDLTTNQICGCEALARWNHSEWGLIFPDQFIALAEQSGLMPALTDRVAEQAFRQSTVFTQAGFPMRCSINVSASSLTDVHFPDRLLHLLAVEEYAPQSVVLEVTESRLFEESVMTLDVLTRLRLKGIELSIDDFGTGYSTFRQLQLVPFTELKIDKQFVTDCLLNNESASIVRISIELAQRLSIRTVAEGVETLEVAERLREWGCDLGQGYFYSKPLAPEAYLEWIKSRGSALEGKPCAQ
jgi:EAL domain-containing protein (putative c-di-GMP-specific phosphodiesterase class I)/FixJ family two-component response regulator